MSVLRDELTTYDWVEKWRTEFIVRKFKAGTPFYVTNHPLNDALKQVYVWEEFMSLSDVVEKGTMGFDANRGAEVNLELWVVENGVLG